MPRIPHGALRLGVAVAALVGAAAPAVAQYAPSSDYQRSLRAYSDQRETYRQDRADYAAAREDYERRLSDYNRQRDNYDRRYGRGSYERRYGPAPYWDEARWAGDHGVDASYSSDACRNRANDRSVAGGLIGALAGAALGSNVAASNARTEGAVLGAVVGGALGANIGKSSARCDDRGYYYSYDQTIPYREGRAYRGRHSGRYDYSYYSRERCRLAPAPVEWSGRTEYRYVRVCPDRDGRYRMTG